MQLLDTWKGSTSRGLRGLGQIFRFWDVIGGAWRAGEDTFWAGTLILSGGWFRDVTGDWYLGFRLGGMLLWGFANR